MDAIESTRGTEGEESSRTEGILPESVGIDGLSSRGIVDVMHGVDVQAWEAFDEAALDALAAVVDAVVDALDRGGRLIYVGAGTSGRLGVLDASECPPTFGLAPDRVLGLIAGGERALRESIEGAEDLPGAGARAIEESLVGEHDVICGISASGTTPFVRGALDEAAARGAVTALICCNRLSAAGRQSGVDHLVELDVGAEVIAGSTRLKSGTATKMALNMITTGAMIRRGKVHDNLMVDLTPVNEKLRRRAVRLVERLGRVDERSARDLLERCNGRVKVAIVAARRATTILEAETLLDSSKGFLRAALDS